MKTRMYQEVFKRCCLGLCLIFSVQLFAQEKAHEPVSGLNLSESPCSPCISPFIELGGKGWISLNVDFRPKETFAFSIAAAGIEEGIAPNLMGYYFGGKRHRLEIGSGLSLNFKDGDIFNLFVHGVIGYRYQKKKGLLFRAGFTPMFVIPLTDEGKNALIPLVGISLGYSF